MVIKFLRHKGLRALYETGRTAGVQASHVRKLRMQLTALDSAQVVGDVDIPGFQLHELRGDRNDQWAISVNGHRRVTFEFRDGNAFVLDYEDYH